MDHLTRRAGRLRTGRRAGTQAGTAQDRRHAHRVGGDARRAAPDQPPGEVLRAGFTTARDRRHSTVVHPQRRSRRGSAQRPTGARRAARLASGVHAQPLPELGRRVERRLADQPAALLRRADPALVPARRRGQPAVRRDPHARRRSVAHRSIRQLSDGLHRRPARQARRVHRGSRRHGYLGDIVGHTAHRRRLARRPRAVLARLPDGPASAGPRHHPHLVVRQRRAKPSRTRLPSVDQRCDLRLDPRPRPQEDVEEQGQRRHADQPAGGIRNRRRALLVGVARDRASTPSSTRGR